MRINSPFVLFFVLLPGTLAAQDNGAAPRESFEPQALEYLRREKGIRQPSDLRASAERMLQESGHEFYKYQRVEVTGIFASDNGDDDPPGLFDGHVTPARWGQSSDTVAPWIEELMHKPQDLAGLAEDSAGQLSRYAADMVLKFKDQNINEIVAHSWGAEIIYNAIFLGKIRPPKRLVLCGVTEQNWEKWKALAYFTGTNVVVYDNKLDPWASAARIGDVTDALGLSHGLKLTNDFEKLASLWELKCAEITGGCNRWRQQGKFERNSYFGRPTHDRDVYYKRMLEDHILTADVAERRAEQDRLIDAKANELYQKELADAEDLYAQDDAEIRKGLNTLREMQHTFRHEHEDSDEPDTDSHPTGAPPLPPPPPDYKANTLKSLAQAACQRNRGLMTFYMGYGDYVLPAGRPYGSDAIAETLTGCDRRVFDFLTQDQPNERHLTIDGLLQVAGIASDNPPVARPRRPRDPDDAPTPHGRVCGPPENGGPAWCTQDRD